MMHFLKEYSWSFVVGFGMNALWGAKLTDWRWWVFMLLMVATVSLSKDQAVEDAEKEARDEHSIKGD